MSSLSYTAGDQDVSAGLVPIDPKAAREPPLGSGRWHTVTLRQEHDMARADERLMEWLRDAHAAEQQAKTMLNGMFSRIENYPQLKARVEQHARETERHAELVRGCIERRGGSTSTIKDAGAKIIALGQAMSGMFV